jgi:hypothetical protein
VVLPSFNSFHEANGCGYRVASSPSDPGRAAEKPQLKFADGYVSFQCGKGSFDLGKASFDFSPMEYSGIGTCLQSLGLHRDPLYTNAFPNTPSNVSKEPPGCLVRRQKSA